LFAVSTKFQFNHPNWIPGAARANVSVRQIDSWTSNGGNCACYLSYATWTAGYREPEAV
jgi:hypothetical protein